MAILVELFVLDKMVEVISGCEVKVVIPFIVFVAVPEPIARDPPDKLEPMVIVAVAAFGCITFRYTVDVLMVDEFIEPSALAI